MNVVDTVKNAAFASAIQAALNYMIRILKLIFQRL